MVARIAILLAAALMLTGCQNESTSGSTEKPLKPMKSDPTALPSLGPGWGLVPRATYTASQTPGQVIIKASGENPTAGFETMLVQSPLRLWPPQYRLARKRADGMVAQVITPFEVSASFHTADPVLSVTVQDAEGLHRVPVDQARD